MVGQPHPSAHDRLGVAEMLGQLGSVDIQASLNRSENLRDIRAFPVFEQKTAVADEQRR